MDTVGPSIFGMDNSAQLPSTSKSTNNKKAPKWGCLQDLSLLSTVYNNNLNQWLVY